MMPQTCWNVFSLGDLAAVLRRWLLLCLAEHYWANLARLQKVRCAACLVRVVHFFCAFAYEMYSAALPWGSLRQILVASRQTNVWAAAVALITTLLCVDYQMKKTMMMTRSHQARSARAKRRRRSKSK